jgi:hypothetical protein
LKVIADWNPVSAVRAGRPELFGNTARAWRPGHLPLQNLGRVHADLGGPVVALVPLSVRIYRRTAFR